jgi:hypothetical protein
MTWKRPPISILVVSVLYLLLFIVAAWRVVMPLRPLTSEMVVRIALDIGLYAYLIVATLRMSRWPILAVLTWFVVRIGVNYYMDPRWTDRYPLSGVFVMIIPMSVFAGLVLPHWKKLNWNLFGQMTSLAPIAPEDVF